MTEHSDDAPRPEVDAFLHDRAGALDRDAAPVSAEEAARRTVVAAHAPRKVWRSAAAASTMRPSARSALAAAAAIAIVVGALGGFAIGRSTAPKKASLATAARSAPEGATTGAPTTMPNMATANGTNSGPLTQSQMTRVFDRTTSDGVDIHAYATDGSNVWLPCPSGDFCPNQGGVAAGAAAGAPSPPTTAACAGAEKCFFTLPPDSAPTTVTAPQTDCTTSALHVELANDHAVGTLDVAAYPLQGAAAQVVNDVTIGQPEGAPANAWVVNTDTTVTSVQAKWSDGFTDSMAPVNGWAVVAHNGGNTDATITALDGSGHVVQTLTTTSTPPADCFAAPSPPATVTPSGPPTLPPVGAEQPDDVDGATKAITDAYTTVFTHGSDPATNATLEEDPASVQAALATVTQNFPQAADTVTVTIGDIHFLSKTDAALVFELDYQGGAEFGQQIGYAKLIDGRWKIARDTLCMVASWGGGQCNPPPDPSRSSTAPSSAN